MLLPPSLTPFLSRSLARSLPLSLPLWQAEHRCTKAQADLEHASQRLAFAQEGILALSQLVQDQLKDETFEGEEKDENGNATTTTQVGVALVPADTPDVWTAATAERQLQKVRACLLAVRLLVRVGR